MIENTPAGGQSGFALFLLEVAHDAPSDVLANVKAQRRLYIQQVDRCRGSPPPGLASRTTRRSTASAAVDPSKAIKEIERMAAP